MAGEAEVGKKREQEEVQVRLQARNLAGNKASGGMDVDLH